MKVLFKKIIFYLLLSIGFIAEAQPPHKFHSKYGGNEYYNYNASTLYTDYKNYCSNCKYEAFTRDNFESKITELTNNGIEKGTYQRSKIFKFHKSEFEKYIKKFEDLEDLPVFDEDVIDEE
jgi:hypothetical protein